MHVVIFLGIVISLVSTIQLLNKIVREKQRRKGIEKQAHYKSKFPTFEIQIIKTHSKMP